MGWFGRLFGSRGSQAPDVNTENVIDSVMNPSSFSIVVFSGDQSDHLLQLFSDCDYEPLRATTAKGDLVQLHNQMNMHRGDDPSLVLKAYWSSPQATVLIDPEMIISGAKNDQLVAFCGKHLTTATTAIWERVSETALLAEISASGVVRSMLYVEGEPAGEQVAPRPELAQEPNETGLRTAMVAAGVPVDQVFAEAEVTVVQLRE